MLTERPIVICDLDGVLSQNPHDAVGIITDKDYWSKHWNNFAEAQVNVEIVHLLKSSFLTESAVMILTARPIEFLDVTLSFLERIGIKREMVDVWNGSAGHDTFFKAFRPTEGMPNIVLKMYEQGTNIPGHSGEWKASVVEQMLNANLNVLYMIEDYKPNADAVRRHIPVLLYERVR